MLFHYFHRYRTPLVSLEPYFKHISILPRIFLSLLDQHEFMGLLKTSKSIITQDKLPMNLVIKRCVHIMKLMNLESASPNRPMPQVFYNSLILGFYGIQSRKYKNAQYLKYPV